ncbi:MAG: hypothetical protein JW854_10725 [Actinobacteria bacterium]|nr:hypothetical protein [Actinomycetota bacterium]
MRSLEGLARRSVQSLLVLLTLGTLAIPPLVVATSGTASVDATWTALRILALYALTILFLNIMTGSFRPLLIKVFKPKLLYRVHNNSGLVGFSMAVAHMVLVIEFGLWPGFEKLGPVALYVFTATTIAILLRKYMKKWWRMIHRLNYAVFVIALIHAFQVGTDVIDQTFIETILIVYAALVGLGFIYRLQLVARTRLKKRTSKA